MLGMTGSSGEHLMPELCVHWPSCRVRPPKKLTRNMGHGEFSALSGLEILGPAFALESLSSGKTPRICVSDKRRRQRHER